MDFLRLIRFGNLVFIAIIQWLIYRCVVVPVILTENYQPAMPKLMLWLLIASTTLITAAGYIINDYFDVKIDEINKPDRVIVGKSISRRLAMGLHQYFSVAGALIGLYVSYEAKSSLVAIIIVITPGALWFYSSVYKRMLLIGNIVVAFLAATVPLILIAVAENGFQHKLNSEAMMQSSLTHHIIAIVGVFALFSFITTLMREIIKDTEDADGDRELECATLPIVYGTTVAKYSVIGLAVLTLVLVSYIYYSFLAYPDNDITFKYLLFMVVMPLIILIVRIATANVKDHYTQASKLLKYIMLAGTLYAVVFYFYLAKSSGILFFNYLIQ